MSFSTYPLQKAALLASLSLALLWLMGSCAQPGSPSGGPPDKTPPQIKDTIPLPRTLNFQGDEVVLKFNEFIKMPSYGKEIFISPFLSTPPQIKVSGKKLKIKFQDYLLPRTTYVISFIDIKDYYANNSLDPPFTLAFSTGSVIDSMTLKGKVLDRYDKGVKDYSIMLFDADSVLENDFMGKRPAYLTKTDANGNFSLSYLRNIDYKIYGISDKDQSNTYSLATEPLALAEQSLVQFPDSGVPELILRAFTPAGRAPRLQSYRWLSDSVMALGFTRGLRTDSLRISLSDTLGQDSLLIQDWSYQKGELLMESHRPREAISRLRLLNMVDSLGLRSDTVLRLRPRRAEPPAAFPMYVAPELKASLKGYQAMLPFPFDTAFSDLISLRDTGDQVLPARITGEGFGFQLLPDSAMNPNLFYFMQLEGALFGEKDTVFRYKLQPFDPASFGSLSGVIRIEDYEGPFVVYLQGPEPQVLTDTVFSFKLLPPGNYEASLLLDIDSNGVWTPGSLLPYRLPERIVKGGEPISIRANWEFEDQEILFQTTPARDSLKKGVDE